MPYNLILANSSNGSSFTMMINKYSYFLPFFFSDFKDITASNNSTSGGTGNVLLPNILLGVTNPFFGKALKHWPHIVKLGISKKYALKK